MDVDFIRVPALVAGLCTGCVHRSTDEGWCNTVNGVVVRKADACFAEGGKYIWAAVATEPAAPARSNDPATSKGKRRVNKYEQAVLEIVGRNPVQGVTGKEIAELSGFALNCITPRFAPLRRADKIKDSGMRRDKQIVWVLT